MIPSTALSSTPAFVQMNANGGSPPQVLGIAESATLSGTTITNYSPGALMYSAVGTDGNTHIYGLSLTGATTPVPAQMSNISLSNGLLVCDWSTSQHNFFQPTTMFLVIHVGGPNGCSTVTGNGDVWEVVEWGASATSAPAVVNITNSDIEYLYNPSGTLSGLMLLDPASHNVYFYTSDAFTSPATIASNMSFASSVLEAQSGSQNSLSFTGSLLFESFTSATSVETLYRIKYDGTFANEYTATDALGGGVSDNTNMYFTDGVQVYAEPLVGGTPLKLYNGPVDWTLVGSNGSLLVMENSGATGSAYAGSLVTIATGSLTSTPTLLGGTANGGGTSNYTGLLDATLVEGTPGTPSTSVVFLTVSTPVGTPTVSSQTYASAAYLPSGTVKQALTNNTAFIASASGLTNTVFSVTGITDTGYYAGLNTYGGGALEQVNVASFATTPMKNAGGTAYTVPTNSGLDLFPLSPTVGPGLLLTAGVGSNPTTESGVAFDTSKNLIVPVTVANSLVVAF